ncbi:NADH-quinone oxidoreductase subunit C [Nakamurella flavida]|nr:NADH-quinone oxidoreductase subunit C [Nakamurella flavida]MDP9777903.1 NADH-quinone oxidoreductase subunit C [Nakamurella flavida]
MTPADGPADGVPAVPAPGGAPGQTTSAAGGYSSVDSPGESPAGTTDDASAGPEGSRGADGTALSQQGFAQASPPVTGSGVERHGMFGTHGGGDTSGYGGLVQEPYSPVPAERPFGGWFDEVSDALAAAMADRGIPARALRQTTVAHGEITYYVERDHLNGLLWTFRDDPALRFEMCSSLSGVDYGPGARERLHVVYELTSMTYRRRVRLEVAVSSDDPHVPSAVEIYPTADWHEREAWDMFGIVFSGHPALTRILMPDDWDGHPQRKDYPLGGIPVEYKGAEIPPPDQRRRYG